MPLIRLTSFLTLLTAAIFSASVLRAEDLNIYFKTSPRVELIRPFADPVGMSLLVTGADGRPIKEGFVGIRLDAPKSGRFFSTDFPFVEGTRLNEMRLPLRQGRANWNFLLPIRGEYHLTVDVATLDGGKASKVFSFKVRENESKWLVLGTFSLALFILGFFAGRIFSQSQAAAVLAFLGVSLFGITESFSAEGVAESLATATFEIDSARVGTPTGVRWLMEGKPGGEKPPALLTLTITHLEKGKVVFGVEKVPVAGEFTMKFQFPDAAEYRTVATADIPGAPTMRNEQLVSVTSSEPPATAMIPALTYFLTIIILGLGAGRWSKLRKAN